MSLNSKTIRISCSSKKTVKSKEQVFMWQGTWPATWQAAWEATTGRLLEEEGRWGGGGGGWGWLTPTDSNKQLIKEKREIRR